MRLYQELSVIILFIIKKLRESNGSLFIFKEQKRLHKCNLNGILEM